MWKRELRPALLMFLVLTVITGALYPLGVTGIAGLLFPNQVDGSLIRKEGEVVGSRLVGQPFDDPKYFWGRPSATGPFPYNASASSGSNLGPANDVLKKAVAERVAALKSADPENTDPVPVDLVTASGSGLDPHITPASAEYQVGRVAKRRGLEKAVVRGLISGQTEGRQFGVLGEQRVHLLGLNLALDDLTKKSQ
ncbi:MAG: potassium-transporting ATPase subunit KdpC [Candidatus Manganitrophaceae bacterium]|nr:MAG: potassium-transporting ATPase subunit KdpC [Candidatus Manganitrophaceae bacterium]